MKRRGFTIVELLMVVGIISILISVTVTAVGGSLKRGREQRANALCKIVASGIATYYAQTGEWPVAPKNNDGDEDYYTYKAAEVQQICRKLVEKTKEGNPVLDVGGLFVSKQPGESGKCFGMDFTAAVRGTKKHPEGIRLSQMYFGYPDPSTGYFRRFKMKYYTATDTISVTR